VNPVVRAILIGSLLLPLGGHAAEVVVASKVFTESVILGELATQLIRDAGYRASHRRELGGTRVLWSALTRGDIACYPEYTGTLRAEIFAGESLDDDAQLRRALWNEGIWASEPLGFNNTYVLGMRRERARELEISRISQLAAHTQLVLGFSNEFLRRADGWPGLRKTYGLRHQSVRGLDHDLAYRAVASGAIDVTDLYSTDAEIAHYDLIALEDEAGFFPDYEALILCSREVPAPVRAAVDRLSGRIDVESMIAMNARAKLDRQPESRVAADFLKQELTVSDQAVQRTRAQRVWRRTVEHLAMVGISLAAAVVIAIPLGIAAFYRRTLGRVVFAIADILQTVPALALLVFLIPWLGIGYAPAVAALFLYSLLPVLRNTHAGLADIPRDLRESAQALGLKFFARLKYVELPLAARSILGGVRIAAVINVGTATLGALIGAGGYGQSILTGIRLDDLGLILEGALPAAGLALLAQVGFGWLERRWVTEK